ncbi:phospholipase D-like domain-containing protein (plasmid) [Pantoea sp. BJ2]|uniref:Phospholipase D-like domain-containing protein n=1 Tax=Pantoea sp. BJ2 TaxID=3141322 RepID=A0AAU7U1P8_9GAMM
MTKNDSSHKIFVKIPFGFGTYRLKILRSQKWGAIDLMILISLLEGPKTSQQISTESSLPKQLIIEILIPLMKAGWVEIVNSDNQFLFTLTERGVAVADGEDLPPNQDPMSVVRSFLIDPLTEECYRFEKKKRKQNYLIYKRPKANSLAKQYGNYCIELKVLNPKFSPKISEILNCLPNENEEVVGIEDEYIKENFSNSLRFMLACVDSENRVTGVPDISTTLKDAIIEAAIKQRKQLLEAPLLASTSKSKAVAFEVTAKERAFQERKVDPQMIKVISGGDDHHQHIIECITNAHSRLIIHSTFINPSTIELFIEYLLACARKRVKIDILWGQTEPDETIKLQQYNQIIVAIEKFQQRINSEGLSTQINIHSTPTGSHSKFIICDDKYGFWSVTIGSCNWLSSGFNRFEASVKVTDTSFVADCLNITSELATGSLGVSNMLSRDLAIEASRLSKVIDNDHNKISNAVSVQLLTSREHHALIKQASDRVSDSFFICSHRFSFAADRPILTPLISAKKDNPNLSIKVAYGRTSGTMKNRDVRLLNKDLEKIGFDIIKADDPQIHAKFVVWDTKNLIISSLNWLSSSSKGHDFSELGVYLHGSSFGDEILNSFNAIYD